MTHELLLTTYEIVVLSMVIRRYANHYGDRTTEVVDAESGEEYGTVARQIST